MPAIAVCQKNKDVTDPPPSLAGKLSQVFVVSTKLKNTPIPVGAAAGCDLLILIFKGQGKRSQPAAAPTGHRSMPASCLNFFKGIKRGVRPGYTAIHCGSWLASDSGVSNNKDVTDPPSSLASQLPQVCVSSKKLKNTPIPVGAAAGCDLLILIFKGQGKRSQPAAAPTGHRSMPASCLVSSMASGPGTPRFTVGAGLQAMGLWVPPQENRGGTRS